MTNFTIRIDHRVRVQDDLTPTQRFEGQLFIAGREEPFGIDTTAYANDAQLRAAVYAAAGPEVQIHCKLDELRNAIGSGPPPSNTVVTTNFGWDSSGTRFLLPDGMVTVDGFRPYGAADLLRVDLSNEEIARHLGFRQLHGAELELLKRHVVEDLLRIHDRRVTYSLLGMAALSVLYRHVNGLGRFALWLRGLTGAGKSFTAKLFANLFGDFQVNPGRFVTWLATMNYIPDRGYYFRDALYLVDDFKPELTRPDQVVRVLQAYADNTARGRLNSKATANPTREIRGMLVSTAEDLPENTASTMGRLVPIHVPQQPKDLNRGLRCLQESSKYSGVMSDFVRFILATEWTGRFAEEVSALQQRLIAGVVGRQNDARVVSNLALLGTAFRAACEFLRDVWPNAGEEAAAFAETDLILLRNEMLAGTREQQASEVFLHALAGLIENKRVKIEGWPAETELPASTPVIGRLAPPSPAGTVFVLCTSLCLEEVNRSLKTQGRPIVAASEKTLVDQLHGDGKLLTPTASGPQGGRRTTQCSLSIGNRRGFLIASNALFGNGETAP